LDTTLPSPVLKTAPRYSHWTESLPLGVGPLFRAKSGLLKQPGLPGENGTFLLK